MDEDEYLSVPYHDMDDMNITLHNCFYFQIDWHGIENFESCDGEIENMDEETHAETHARTVALAQRHARSEKLMKENRLKVMLNNDEEIENMDEETHAERHARTVALAQVASSSN
ncbi:hypothetical protein OIU84_025761 [Salix udensis]|uniref:Uncharacterized protein n=1 Tax=Salix udensis TaxID=889485 RepID=A0AAD6PC43_9ROSI|nr:hypothetical protein OIU84_025761 [Salix udensis]